MVVGRVGEKRGTSLAMLGGDGNIYHIEPSKTGVSPGTTLAPTFLPQLKADPFEPADSPARAMAMISQEPRGSGDVDSFGRPFGDA